VTSVSRSASRRGWVTARGTGERCAAGSGGWSVPARHLCSNTGC
jgi:hypothetical protein